MEISIIILNYKQRGLVKQCIKGIELVRPKYSYEIIVVDNNSQDGCIKMIQEDFTNVIARASEKNGGFAYGNNLGIRNARGRYILILNPDVAVVEGAIEKMFLFLETTPRAGIAAPRLIHPDGTIQYSARRFPKISTPIFRRTFLGKFSFAKKELNRYLMTNWDHNSQKRVEWIFGACMMIRKSALENVGLFDERFFLYFEDCDLCRRFWERGHEVWYLPQVELVHYHQRLSGQGTGFSSLLGRGTRYHVESAIKYFAKYIGTHTPISL